MPRKEIETVVWVMREGRKPRERSINISTFIDNSVEVRKGKGMGNLKKLARIERSEGIGQRNRDVHLKQ